MYTFNVQKETDNCVYWIRDWFKKNAYNKKAIVGVSGGKDSTIVLALCVRALGPKNVIGVMMPDKGQGLDHADQICQYFGVKSYKCPIRRATRAINRVVKKRVDDFTVQSEQNIPPRVRMTVLYAVAQSENGMVANTCNYSEDYIGYSTLFGDNAGSFAPIKDFTVTELRLVGRALGIPTEWINKTPSDGLPHSTSDEEKLGFTYAQLDAVIRPGSSSMIVPDSVRKLIETRHKANLFKERMVHIDQFTWYHEVKDDDKPSVANPDKKDDYISDYEPYSVKEKDEDKDDDIRQVRGELYY